MTPCAIQLPLAIQPIAARNLRPRLAAVCGMETKAVNSQCRGASALLSDAFCCGLLSAQRRPRRRTNGTRPRRQRALSAMSAMHSRNCESRCLAPHAPVGPICPAASESMASVVMSHC